MLQEEHIGDMPQVCEEPRGAAGLAKEMGNAHAPIAWPAAPGLAFQS